MRKARFESRNLTSGPSEMELRPRKKYTGPERRRKSRRVAEDRRQEIRFDLTRGDRRHSIGRRHEDLTVSMW